MPSLEKLLENSSDFAKINPSLKTIEKALAYFSNPHEDFKSIIIAGTNGKGSVCSFLEQLCFNYTDLKIAKFISPHLISPTERIRVKNQDIDEQTLAKILEEIKTTVPQDLALSYFEKLFLAAIIYFSREKVDLAILEVGMGGRWDCANIIPDDKRLATVITSISLDHMEFLGDTVEKIRAEKEAIKRASVPHFDYKDFDLPLAITQRNYQLALKVFNSLFTDTCIDEKQIFKGFHEAYRARFEYLADSHSLIDSAHNPEAAQALADYLQENFPDEEYEFHLAFLDKDYKGFIEKLAPGKYYIYQLQDSRAADAQAIVKEFKNKLEIEFSHLEKPKQSSKLKIYSGSIYFCGEILKLI